MDAKTFWDKGQIILTGGIQFLLDNMSGVCPRYTLYVFPYRYDADGQGLLRPWDFEDPAHSVELVLKWVQGGVYCPVHLHRISILLRIL